MACGIVLVPDGLPGEVELGNVKQESLGGQVVRESLCLGLPATQ